MNPLSQLMEKPWLPASSELLAHTGHHAGEPNARFGLRVLLAVLSVLFALIAVSYLVRMMAYDWEPLPEPHLLWLNTLVLILSSVAMQWARVASGRGEMKGVKTGLLAGGIFALSFLIGQVVAWQQLGALGFFLAGNPASTFFYLITALHGLHLIGGMVAWGKAANRVWGAGQNAQWSLTVELCAVYWHFLLIVWLIMFTLLLFT